MHNKKLATTFHLAENIVIKKRDEDTQTGKGQHGIKVLSYTEECDTVDKKGETAQSGCQPIKTVNKVDGIDNKDIGILSASQKLSRGYFLRALPIKISLSPSW